MPVRTCTVAERLRSRIRPITSFPEDPRAIPDPEAWGHHVLSSPDLWNAKLGGPHPHAPGVPCAWIYVSGGAILGHQGVLPALFDLGTSTVPGAWAVDLYVDPKERAKGIGALLTERLEQVAPIAAAGGLTEAAEVLCRRRGWIEPFELMTYVRPLSLRGLLRAIGIPAWMRGSVAAIDALLAVHDLARVRRARGVLTIRGIERFDPSAEALSQRLAPSIGAHARRFADTLNRRFLDHPTRRYRSVGLFASDRLDGYAVLRTGSYRRVRLGIIADFLCAPDRFAALMAAAFSALRRDGADIAIVRFFGPAFGRAPERLGFLRWGTRLPLFVHVRSDLRDAMPDLFERPWFVTWGDSDMEWELPA